MGACMSSESNEDLEKKKRSRAIDARLEEDSKRLRRECKILLLGRSHQSQLALPLLMSEKGPEKVASPPLSSK